MKQNIAAKISELILSTVEKHGFVLWDVTYGKEATEMILTVVVDKEGGVSIESLSKLNDDVNSILDEADPIQGAYSLMMESAGLERVLRTDGHFAFAVRENATVKLKLYKALDKVKEFEGKAVGFDGETLTVEAENETKAFEKKQISKIIAYL